MRKSLENHDFKVIV